MSNYNKALHDTIDYIIETYLNSTNTISNRYDDIRHAFLPYLNTFPNSNGTFCNVVSRHNPIITNSKSTIRQCHEGNNVIQTAKLNHVLATRKVSPQTPLNTGASTTTRELSSLLTNESLHAPLTEKFRRSRLGLNAKSHGTDSTFNPIKSDHHLDAVSSDGLAIKSMNVSKVKNHILSTKLEQNVNNRIFVGLGSRLDHSLMNVDDLIKCSSKSSVKSNGMIRSTSEQIFAHRNPFTLIEPQIQLPRLKSWSRVND